MERDADDVGSGTSEAMESQSYGAWWQGPALGLLATGAGLAAAELVVGLIDGSASPVVPVGQVFIDAVPRPLKEWAIETFGTNDKAVLVFGALIVVLGIGVAVGVLAGGWDGQTTVPTALTIRSTMPGRAPQVAQA